MLQYLINTSAIWLISLALFDLFLKKENYHGYNRFYLMFTFVLGTTLPLWQLNGNKPGGSLDDILMLRPGLLQWVIIIYLVGAAVNFILLLIEIIKLVYFYRSGTRAKEDGWVIIETGRDHPPFSYLDLLFVSARARYSPEEWDMILSHEQRHSVLLHLVDMLLMQLARITFWFNPLVYIYHTRLLLVHEYQADEFSSKQPEQYGKFLVEQSVLRAAPAFSHSFNRSPIKNRILMLLKNAKPRTGISNLKLLIVVPLTVACVLFFSKNSYSIDPPGAIWKKQVCRMIDLGEQTEFVPRHLREDWPDTTLLEVLVSAIDAGKLTAYSNQDDRFTTKISSARLKEQMIRKPDTMILVDPVSGKEMTKVVKHEIDYSVIRKYRIVEEWTYSERTKKTEIEVLGIAPVVDIYVDNQLRGHKAIFYVRYNDIQNILARYELYHPHNTLAKHIWEDNFKADAVKGLD